MAGACHTRKAVQEPPHGSRGKVQGEVSVLTDIRQHLLLAGLAECEAVGAKCLEESAVVLSASAHRQDRHETLDRSTPWVDPVGEDLRTFTALLSREVEEGWPRVGTADQPWIRAVRCGDVLAHRMAAIAVDPPLSLLEVHGVGRKIPVHYSVGVVMEVQSLLADRCRRENEGP